MKEKTVRNAPKLAKAFIASAITLIVGFFDLVQYGYVRSDWTDASMAAARMGMGDQVALRAEMSRLDIVSAGVLIGGAVVILVVWVVLFWDELKKAMEA